MDSIIETERLLLRPLREADADVIAALINDYDIAKNLARVPFPYSRSDADEFLAWVKSCTSKSRFSAICHRDAPDQFQGCISYEWNEDKRDADFGYWLVKPLWGHGIMTEAARAMVDHAFETAQIPTLVSCYFDSNPASGKVLHKAGFEVTGPCMHYCRAQNCEVPVTTMRLTRERWFQNTRLT